MLIVCPACASEYEIPTDRVGPGGRQVRCAACRETWFITPEAATDAEPPAETSPAETVPTEAVPTEMSPAEPPGAVAEGPVLDQPMPYPQPEAAEPRPKRTARAKGKPKAKPKRSAGGKAGLRALSPALAAGLVLFVFVPLALLGRSTVVRAMPQTAAVFSGIGLPVNLRGVDLREIVAFQNPAEGDKPGELIVEGDLVGAGRERVDVPDLAVAVRDEHGQLLYRWTVPAPRAALENAETARFRASLSAPPAKGRAVEVRFVDAKVAEPAADKAHPKESEPAGKPAGEHHGAEHHGAEHHSAEHGPGANGH